MKDSPPSERIGFTLTESAQGICRKPCLIGLSKYQSKGSCRYFHILAEDEPRRTVKLYGNTVALCSYLAAKDRRHYRKEDISTCWDSLCG